MQYGTQWLIYKFNMTKPYLEKVIKNGGTQNFHKFVYDEILNPDPTNLLPVFFHNRASAREAIFCRVSRKYLILLGSVSMLFLTRNNGALNVFITPELYRDAKKSFVKNLTEIGLYRVTYNLLRVFRNKLGDPYLNINALYEFECEKTVVTTFKEDDFVLPKFNLKIELADRTASDDVSDVSDAVSEKFFDLKDTILIKPDKMLALSNLKEKLFGQGEIFSP